MGSFVNAGEAFEAWTSGDLCRMLSRKICPHEFDRSKFSPAGHRQRGVSAAGVDPEMRRICIETGLMHLEEFRTIAPALQKIRVVRYLESLHSRGWLQ